MTEIVKETGIEIYSIVRVVRTGRASIIVAFRKDGRTTFEELRTKEEREMDWFIEFITTHNKNVAIE